MAARQPFMGLGRPARAVRTGGTVGRERPVSWLLRDGDVMATVEVADSFAARTKGLLGRDGYEGAMVLPRTRPVHTFGMRFAVDVAFCDKEMVVLGVTTLRPWRMSAGPAGGPARSSRPRPAPSTAGACGSGDRLELRE